MTTSQKNSFLSDIAADDFPIGKLAYFRARLKNRLYNFILEEFEKSGLSRADLARRMHIKSSAQITRLLGAPGNWTLDTISDLLLTISKAEPNFVVSPLLGRAPRNYSGPDWLPNINITRTSTDFPQSRIVVESKPFTKSNSVKIFSQEAQSV